MQTTSDALARAREAGIRVARLSEEVWRVESSAPALRGPYLVIAVDADVAECQCLGGAFGAVCHHRAAVFAARAGTYPVSDAADVRGPAEWSATRTETREERRQRMIREYDAVSAERRATATVTPDDYAMFG